MGTLHQSIVVSSVTLSDQCPIYQVLPEDTIMKSVRQFHANDGSVFIEHVPGHCLVFVPNNAQLSQIISEARRVRKPKPRAKPRTKSSKPTNSFIKYRNEKIAELKIQHPDISQTTISRLAGQCWHSESEEVKHSYRKRYLEEKRIYDLNKDKRPRLDGGAGPDSPATALLGVPPTYTLGVSGSAIPPFQTGRRRSHTLPLGEFSRSGAKRRISQDFRKHLASMSGEAFRAAAAAAISADGSVGSSSVPSDHSQFPTQYQNAAFAFSFPPQLGTPGVATPPMWSEASTSYASPSYAGSSYASSAYAGSEVSLAMPINPNFPISDFASSVSDMASQAPPPAPSQSQHHGMLAGIATPLSLDNVIPSSHPLLDTSALGAHAGAINTGYMPADASSLVPSSGAWTFPPPYTLIPDQQAYTSGMPLHQQPYTQH
ncbi:hypothetical protein H4R19_005708 [Coemansia spiralis]|nr:hypothetical protein H4R19_005708 [Coemansia spiralis]